MAREGVQSAIADLARMERRLVRATKRQKANVESTHFTTIRTDKVEEEFMKPNPTSFSAAASTTEGVDRGPAATEHLPTPERESQPEGMRKLEQADKEERMKEAVAEAVVETERGPSRCAASQQRLSPLFRGPAAWDT